MLFFFLFNYGQPLMWAFGIHQTREIGQVGLYTLGVPNTAEIVLAQSITLVSIILFHFGAVCSYKGKRNKNTYVLETENSLRAKISRKAIYKTSVLLSFVAIPITFYNVIPVVLVNFNIQ